MKSFEIGKTLLIAALVAITAQWALAQDAGNSSGDVSVLVQLTPLQKGSLPQQIKGFGRVVPAEAAKTAIAADVAGVVASVDVYKGEFVKKGADILTIAPNAEAQSSYKQARLAVEFAQKLLDETRSMVKAHLKTNADLEKQKQALETARLKLQALKAIGADGPRTITAPHAAVVLALNVGAGDAVSKGTLLADLADPTNLLLDAEIPPAETRGISVGNAAKIIATDSGATFGGKVESKGSMISASGGMGRVQVSVPKGQMIIGEHAMVLIDAKQLKGYLVPHSAVLVNDSGHTYIVQSSNMTAHLVPVDVLASDGSHDIVRGKLLPGADVVLSGNHQAQEGMKLRIESADAATSTQAGGN